ncbi:GNAT family N-acetyltransferase [Paenibacillus sp. P36]|uniref:GNAT family N-acetyltransferase n=1 Tax=Paenibacillus sp. P36 TaxID=3342538 RepID=UPI0038B37264
MPFDRSKNIGQQLLQYVEDYCKEINCHRIMLLSNSSRERAHQFFEREGYDGSVSKERAAPGQPFATLTQNYSLIVRGVK